jgi:hypothetical protein
MASDEQYNLDADVLFRAVGSEGVVVDQRVPAVLVVNAVALRVLEMLRANTGKAALIAALAEEFDAAPERIETDVEQFLAELKKREMLH